MNLNKSFKDGSERKFSKEKDNKFFKRERPISSVYPVIDNDLARDNIENDLTSADLQDLDRRAK